MDRKILFRGKRLDNGEWVEGYLFDDGLVESEQFFIGDLVIEKEDGDAAYDYCITGRCFYAVSHDTICRYTGLTDKNGRKIFEGDIVKHYNDKYQPSEFDVGTILWDAKSCKFHRSSKRNDAFCLIDNTCEYEVVGNIFDSQSLLKGGME